MLWSMSVVLCAVMWSYCKQTAVSETKDSYSTGCAQHWGTSPFTINSTHYLFFCFLVVEASCNTGKYLPLITLLYFSHVTVITLGTFHQNKVLPCLYLHVDAVTWPCANETNILLTSSDLQFLSYQPVFSIDGVVTFYHDLPCVLPSDPLSFTCVLSVRDCWATQGVPGCVVISMILCFSFVVGCLDMLMLCGSLCSMAQDKVYQTFIRHWCTSIVPFPDSNVIIWIEF